MLLTPLLGVGLDDLIQTMDSTRTEAFNLRGGGGAPTAHKRLLAYLEWAGRAARMLRGRISGKIWRRWYSTGVMSCCWPVLAR